MLDEIKISGLRGLDGLHLKGADKYNLIVGPNNSGKTSFLESLYLHCSPLNFQAVLSTLSLRNGGIQLSPHYIFEQLGWLFAKTKGQNTHKIEIEGRWKNVKRKTGLSIADYERGGENMASVFLPDTTSFPNFSRPEQRNESKGIRIGTIFFSFQSDKQDEMTDHYDFITKDHFQIVPPKINPDITAALSEPWLHKKPDSGIQEYDKSVKKNYDRKCLALMQKIDPDIENISILLTGGAPQLFVTHKKLGKMPLSNFGDGIRKMYLIAVTMASCEGGVFLIDELESSIDSNALKSLSDFVLSAAKELDVQIFATTHSLECIDAVLAGNFSAPDDLSLFKFGSKGDQISCKKISGKILKDIRYEFGQDVRG
ncbi:MAG: hypothetical protein DRI57_18610 [Deltaproteobacteria bacterium]|nr:MAG: hypothetical protein DRI57_18610 [Deltaproteobacteria bacterium]